MYKNHDLSKFTDFNYDSRKVNENSIFIAIQGEKTNGHNYLEDAVKKGAKLIVVQASEVKTNSDLKNLITKLKSQAEFIEVEETRAELAKIADEFYDHPSSKLEVIGVTGTNGKTTVTHLIQSILSQKSKCALLGTIGLKVSPEADYKELGNTTPQAKELQEIIKDLAHEKYNYLTMEVSSHALEQSRVGEIKFKTTIVTNLTQDHLDYHITMDNYFEAKAKVFKQTKEFAILNIDDPYYEGFKAKAQAENLKIITVGVENSADYQAKEVKFTDAGLCYKLNGIEFKLKLNGLFNVYNSLSAIAACLQENLSLEEINQALKETPAVSGRFEVIKETHSPFCIVDYAHSPDGLLNILKGAQALVSKDSDTKVICVFGCGGDRDITKRPKMGRIAYDLADFIYVTSDNPRSEEPEQIIADILTGIPDLAKVKVITNRAEAIKEAVLHARAQDILVIAGKGHENYQILKDKTIHFDDREEVREAIKQLATKA